jgi:Protein of unknown function (DUF2924)
MSIAKEVAALERMTVKDLRVRYAGAFGEETNAANKQWLIKRIAWRLQAQAEGDLSERARQRAAELANDADLRLSPPKATAPAPAPERTMTLPIAAGGKNRVPIPGTVIARFYKGQTLQVKVLASGFEYEGEVFKSLSAVAKAITGQHCNGFYFFRLGKEATR